MLETYECLTKQELLTIEGCYIKILESTLNTNIYSLGSLIILNNVFIGVNSIIMPGVKIEDNVIVAAGSVITKSIPSGVIVAGVPAKIIGSYSEIEKRMLDLYVSDKDLNNKLNYEERVNSVLTSEFKPFLKNQ